LAGVVEDAGVGDADKYVIEREHNVVEDGKTDQKK